VRKLILQMMTTLDGYFAGPNGEADWHVVDDEFNQYVEETLSQTDCLIFGRVTYELMAGFWPTEHARRNDPVTAKYMNELSKIVVSRTMERADWINTRLIRTNVGEEIRKLKEQPGKDLLILGSSQLAFTLKELIDEYRFFINPVMLGEGKTVFNGNRQRMNFELMRARTFRSGNVLLYYRNAKG